MAATQTNMQSLIRVCTAGFLAWLVPGAGHILLRHRTRGLILLITITLTFWSGVALGGPQDTVDPHKRLPWFMAQICTGSHGLIAYAWGEYLRAAPDAAQRANPSFASVDAAVVYTGIAGLLNLLVILDALSRADQPAPAPTPPTGQPARGSP